MTTRVRWGIGLAAAALTLAVPGVGRAQAPDAALPESRQPGARWFTIPPARPESASPTGAGPDEPGHHPALALLYEGMLNLQDRELVAGVVKLEKAIALDPTLLDAWEMLGWGYWQIQRRTDTLALWERLRQLSPRSARPYTLLGHAAAAENRFADAADWYRQSLEREPGAREIRFAYATSLSALNRHAESIPLLESLVRDAPERADIRIELAEDLAAQQRYEESAGHWKQIVDTVPENPGFQVELAQMQLYAGRLEEARETAQAAASRLPESVRPLQILADLAELSAEPQAAEAPIRALIDRAEDPIVRSRLRERLAGLRLRLHETDPGRFPLEPAIEEAERALQDDPRFTDMRLMLGDLHLYKRKAFAEAESCFRAVLDENPQNLQARRGLLELALAQGRYNEAEQMIDTIHRDLNEGNPLRYLDLARLEQGRGRYFDALRYLDRLEREARRGAVLCLGYGLLGATDWEPGFSRRLFREHLLTLARAEFTFLTPDQIPAYFDSRRTLEAPAAALPLPARALRWIRAGFTEMPEAASELDDNNRPDRVVCITIDGAHRATLRHATPVAEEFGLRFGLHLAAEPDRLQSHGLASWEEIRAFAQSGRWEFGSLGLDADRKAPVNRNGYPAAALPNRLWLADRNRLETQREWSLRLRREMRDSRARILESLRLGPEQVRFLAYPGGDIGQAGTSNIRAEQNVPAVVMNEAGVHYRIGFLPGTLAYAMAADQPLALRRRTPGRQESGEAVLRHALITHPLMMARRLRAEIAAHQGKPHLALEQLRLLERDGYPTDELDAISRLVREQVADDLPAETTADAPMAGAGLVLSRPSLGLAVRQEQANRDFLDRRLTAQAGVNLAERLRLDGEFRSGRLEQEADSNRWFTVRQTRVSESRTLSEVIDNGAITRVERITRRETTTEVETNLVDRMRFRSDYTYWGARLTGRLGGGSWLEGHLGAWSVSGDPGSDTLWAWGATHRWKPVPALSLLTRYARDRVDSARRSLHRDAFSLQVLWTPVDRWTLDLLGAFQAVSDTNTLLEARVQSLWLLGERQNLEAGFRAELVTADDASIYYWSPYWNERVYGLGRVSRAYPRFYMDTELRLGFSREKARPETIEAWRALRMRGEQGGWHPGERPGSDWEPVVGLNGALLRRVGRATEIGLTGACSFFSDYSDYQVGGTVTIHF